jgi:broad specificity phosphatase PhoE
MPRLYMIRHGKAAAGWDGDADPGLDALGQQQAEAVAAQVKALVKEPAPIFTSPLKRCQETAIPLALEWGVTPQIEVGVGEIPPPVEDLTARTAWLRRVMAGSWQGLFDDEVSVESGQNFRNWYDNVPAALHRLGQAGEHVIIFSHFIALNVAYCEATGAQDVVSFAPQNCSLNIFETDGETLTLIQQGEETEDMKIALGKSS